MGPGFRELIANSESLEENGTISASQLYGYLKDLFIKSDTNNLKFMKFCPHIGDWVWFSQDSVGCELCLQEQLEDNENQDNSISPATTTGHQTTPLEH